MDAKAVRYFVRRSNEAGRMAVRSRGVETLLKIMGLLQDGVLFNAAQVAPESNNIAVYKGRIEIDNPGCFSEGMDPEDFIF